MMLGKSDDFEDVQAERGTIAGVLQYGADVYIEVDDLLGSSARFNNELHQNLWECIQHHFSDNNDKKIDVASILSAAKEIGLDGFLGTSDERKYVRSLTNYPIEKENVRGQALRVAKLAIVKMADKLYAKQRKKFRDLTGGESFEDIIASIENPIFDFTGQVNSSGQGAIQIAKDARDWLQNVLDHPKDNIGIPTPFARYNKAIGGGYRRQNVGVVGARMKVGKSFFSAETGSHVAGQLQIPVFYVDTEMTQAEQMARILANKTGILIDSIESGKVKKADKNKLWKAMDWIESIPFHYVSVRENTFEEQLAIMRRWVNKVVGVREDGVRNDCLVIYDYLQANDQEEYKGGAYKENQIFSFHMQSLMKLVGKLDVPMLSLTQLNRDGIDGESTAVMRGGDGVLFKCANFSILKWKSAEEIANDGVPEGTHKLVQIFTRFGSGKDRSDYISIDFQRSIGKMTEKRSRFEIDQQQASLNPDGFIIETDNDEPIQF